MSLIMGRPSTTRSQVHGKCQTKGFKMRSCRQDPHFWERLLLFLQRLMLQHVQAEPKYNPFARVTEATGLDGTAASEWFKRGLSSPQVSRQQV